MGECEICKEKQHTITRVLKAYKKDKKIYMITIAVLIVELIFSLAYGKEGLVIAIEKIGGLLK